jgi:hypothetical protein
MGMFSKTNKQQRKNKLQFSPLTAIRKKCMDCSNEDKYEVLFCCIVDCPLWYFRKGSYPGTLIKKDKNYKIIFNPQNFKEKGIFSFNKTTKECLRAWNKLKK